MDSSCKKSDWVRECSSRFAVCAGKQIEFGKIFRSSLEWPSSFFCVENRVEKLLGICEAIWREEERFERKSLFLWCPGQLSHQLMRRSLNDYIRSSLIEQFYMFDSIKI